MTTGSGTGAALAALGLAPGSGATGFSGPGTGLTETGGKTGTGGAIATLGGGAGVGCGFRGSRVPTPNPTASAATPPTNSATPTNLTVRLVRGAVSSSSGSSGAPPGVWTSSPALVVCTKSAGSGM